MICDRPRSSPFRWYVSIVDQPSQEIFNQWRIDNDIGLSMYISSIVFFEREDDATLYYLTFS